MASKYKRIHMQPKKRVIFDTETTGLRPGQIAQLSYIVTAPDLTPLKAVSHYFKVDFMEAEAGRINNLSVEGLKALSDGMIFSDHFDEIYEDFKDAIPIAHNASFDISFINAEFIRCGAAKYNPEYICTMNLFRYICNFPGRYGKIKPPSLSELIKYNEIDRTRISKWSNKLFNCGYTGHHDARWDTTAVFLIYREAVKQGFI